MHAYNKNYDYVYVNTPQQLSSLCAHYKTRSVLAIDTEFVRTQTLTPILGLIQVFDKQNVALIDPVAIKDLSKFSEILCDHNIVKVAHACSEDLEALWHHLQIIPTPLYDTQFAAGLIGLGVSVGYANLVEKLFEISVDKGESRTDWIQRPLSDAQCAYASADVTHLMALYEHIFDETQSRQISHWVFDEIQHLGIKKALTMPADIAYYFLKNNWKLKGKQLLALQTLAKWRLEVARRENMAVNFVIKEVALFELASKLPDTPQALFECHNLYSRQARFYKDELLSICQWAKKADSSQFIPKIQRLVEFKGYKACLSALKEMVEYVAQQQNVPEAVLASKKQMRQLLKWCWFDFDELALQDIKPDMLSGWRGELFAPYLRKSASGTNIPLSNDPKNKYHVYAILAGHHEIKRSL